MLKHGYGWVWTEKKNRLDLILITFDQLEEFTESDVKEISVCNSQGYILNHFCRCTTETFAYFQADGSLPESSDCWKISVRMWANSDAASLRTLAEMRSGQHALVTAIFSCCFLTPCREMWILGILSQGEIPGEGMDDKSSSLNAVSNCSRRVSVLEESSVWILLFCGNGGLRDTNRLGHQRQRARFVSQNCCFLKLMTWMLMQITPCRIVGCRNYPNLWNL